MDSTDNKILVTYKITLHGSYFIEDKGVKNDKQAERQKIRDSFLQAISMDDNITVEHTECSVEFEDINMI